MNIKKRFFNKQAMSKLPGYIILNGWVLFTVIVIGWIIFASLSTTREIFTSNLLKSGIQFKNYYNALVVHNVSRYFMNSVIYTISANILVILIAAPCAYVLARFQFRGNSLIQNMFVGSLGIPQIMIIIPLFFIASTFKMMNSRALIILLYTCFTVPFTVFFLISFFATLPVSLEESASMDGCSPIKTFWLIMFPLAQPGIITVVIFNFIVLWNEFFIALIFANTSELRPLAVGLYAMIRSMRYIGDWAGMFAAVIIVFVPTFIIYIFLSKKIIAGVTGGAVKG
ncbi:MAG: carbohydrate ABC transporter permease [Spirochaetaceae bacterium]